MALLLLLGASAQHAGGQELRSLTLTEAIAEARENNPDVAITEARAAGAREQVTVAGASRWPSLGLEAGVVTSNDPVAAFGGRLRQGRFTQADFDPAALNDPDALTDLNGALALSWRPIDFSRDAALGAARSGAEAARLGSEWARTVAGYQAEVRYLEAAGAELLLESANAALEAAEENVRLVEERAEEGTVTEADVLQARAALEDARAQSINAEQGVADARGRLGLALGWPADVVPVPTSAATTLSSDAPTGSTPSARTDLAASEARVEAASATVSRARRARLPRLEGFAKVEAHTDEAFAAHGDSWTVGMRVSVPLFTGFELGARKEAAQAELTAATLEHDRLVDEARTTLSETRRGAESRRRAALAAEASAEAAEEAARLLRMRYDEGLATTAELLAAEAAAIRFTNAAVQARLDHRITQARLLLLDDPRLDTDSPEGANR